MIEIEKVCVDFTAGRGTPTRAVDDVSLHIAAGEIFGIVGTSGAGKSTLLRTLNALTRPSQGRVNVNGVEISALDGKALRQARQRIGMIFQHFNLMHTRTVAQNVAFSLKAAGWERSKIAPRVAEILTLVGLADKANHTLNLTLPERLREHLPGQLLKILFIGDSAEQPVLSEVAIKFGVAVNILHGKIEYIGERALGILVVQLTAPHNPTAVAAAVEHIRQRTAQVEVIRG
ncbi:ATP-binding cassette domain-containing protein [Salmonella enterica]|nr:ATP-binding cassette domain-containing protein [Salmonella enterica]EHE5502699.1 ATP-binding cassette domain-containing protein [Salmonella enterica subsp. enterica serovar Dublin]EHA5511301.1 ATP-binding cassette domain-containing protein [Salmonella enterica]EJZ0048624.1 ATP-binding cassette domain-containing protein [Salmonella enterica subsp. enterica serovar Dublin]EJZ1446650.1 ATP-binding cassette domain-containing protein [Salmonella enterica subsp. enterica serovar Dublin]